MNIKDMITALYYKVHDKDLCSADGPFDCRTYDEIAHILGYVDEADMISNCKDEDASKLTQFLGEHFRTLWLAARAKHGTS